MLLLMASHNFPQDTANFMRVLGTSLAETKAAYRQYLDILDGKISKHHFKINETYHYAKYGQFASTNVSREVIVFGFMPFSSEFQG